MSELQNLFQPETPNPRKIGKYQIVEELGRGSMGCVYKAFDPHMGKFVALKVLLEDKDQEQIQRFIREVRAMAKVNHPNIVKVYITGQDSNYTYFTMDYIEGVSLKKFLKNTKPNIRLFSQIMVKIGKAMTYAHGQGIIHRDLKPSNIMLDKNFEPYVMDFGLVKLTSDNTFSKKGSILGTPKYMSPEQAKGKKVNHLTDVYALGAIFYEMLVGESLVKGKNVTDVLYKVIHGEPDLLRVVNSNLSKDLEIICHKAVAKEIEKRYQSAKEFVNDIERFLHGEIIKARTFSIWEKTTSKIRRNKLVVVAGAIGILCVIVGIWIFEKRQGLEVYLYLTKAKEWQQKAASQKVVDKQMEMYIKASSFLEKTLQISPKDFSIKEKLIKIQKTMGMLSKEQKDYLLSFTLFKRCRNLGDKEAQKLLKELEQEKNRLPKKHKSFISKVMQEILQNTLQEELLDRYVFTIVKMKKPYVIEILLTYLKTGSKKQRLLAIKAIGKFGNAYTKFHGKDSVEWLLQRLERFKEKEIIPRNQEEIEEIIWALGWLKDKRANFPIHKLRWRAGQNSLLWDKTKIPYRWIPLENILVQNATSFFTRGNMKQEKKDFQGAMVDYSKAIALNPKYSYAYNARGNVYDNLKEYSKAIADYSKAIELNSKYSLVYNNRGNAYGYLKEYSKAIADYSKAIELNPKYSEAYNNRGIAYKDLKEYSKAIADFSKAISFNPKYSLAYNGRGNAYGDLKEYDKAIADFSKVIALNPKLSEAYNNRGNIYGDLKEHVKAIADFSKAIVLNPKFSLAYNNRGLAYNHLKEYSKAIADTNKAITLDSENYEAHNNRGLSYWHLKEYAKAIADFSKAIALNPKDSEVYNNRGNVYGDLKEHVKAIADYSKAIILNPKNLKTYYNRALTYQTMKEYHKSIVDYNKMIALNPKFPYAYVNAGSIYLYSKQYQKAYQYFQMFLKLAPNDSVVPRIRVIINNLKKKNLIK